MNLNSSHNGHASGPVNGAAHAPNGTASRGRPPVFEDTSHYPSRDKAEQHQQQQQSHGGQAAYGEDSKKGGFRVWLLVAFCLAAGGLLYVGLEMTSASSLQGASIGNLIHMRAGLAGTVQEVGVREGEPVKLDDVLIRMDETELRKQLGQLEQVAALKEAEAAQIRTGQEEEKKRLTLLHEISQRMEKTIRTEMEELQLQYELAEERARELAGSLQQGSANRFEYLEAEVGRKRVEKQIEQKSGALELQKLITHHATEGRYFHDGEVRSLLDELRIQEATVLTELGQLRYEAETLRSQLNQAELRAHRDAQVYAVHFRPGSSVQPGEPLITLETDDDLWVIASFKFDEAEKIAYGDRARIEFPAIPGPVSGTVRSIGHESLGSADQSSPFLRTTPEEVLVKIRLDERPEYLRSGMRANVRVNTSDLSLFAWLFPDNEPASEIVATTDPASETGPSAAATAETANRNAGDRSALGASTAITTLESQDLRWEKPAVKN